MFKTSENIFVGLAGAAVGAAAGAGAAKVLPGKHDTKVPRLITPRGFRIPALKTSFRKPQLLVLQSDSPLVDIRKNRMKKRKRTKNKFLPILSVLKNRLHTVLEF